MASSLLKNVELLGSNVEMNDFGMNWDEENINLGLFEELSEIEYTPPASPKKTSLQAQQQPHLSEHSIANFDSVEELVLPPTDSAAVSALTAEFQKILESLPKENTIMDIGGIPTTVIDGEALVPVEIDLSLLSAADLRELNIDIDGANLESMDDEDDMEIIDESELNGLNSPTGSSVYSLAEDVIVEDEDDRHANTAELILDALLVGDVNTAQSYVNVEDDSSRCSSVSSGASSVSFIEEVKPKKTERRGRKPTKRLAKGSLDYIRDKGLRKKEQNKTAATRYRQKKKMEVAVTLETEAQLQEKHDDLEKKKDDLQKQILMVKQLLREVMNAKKAPSLPVFRGTSSSTVVSAASIPVSRVVGRNRRK
jgi:cyclic AMP-dependent transcription factor ATF-4